MSVARRAQNVGSARHDGPMSENVNESPSHETAALTGSGDVREGAQVIMTTGVPANFEPPSAALLPPTTPAATQAPAEAAPPPSQSPNQGATE
jgi:hypothetical protein